MLNKIFQSENDRVDLIQKTAWRLVRSAEDRMGIGKGHEKLLWCLNRLSDIFKDDSRDILEDYIRSAFINMKIEMSALNEQRIVGGV